MSACSDASQNKGASWKGALNFMHVTKDSMQMTYSVDVMGPLHQLSKSFALNLW